MAAHQFTLHPYKSIKDRHTCPGCGKKQVFSRYINTDTGEYLADHVGRCNREVSCEYHYKPSQYFADNGIELDISKYSKEKNLLVAPLPVISIPANILQETLTDYDNNNFVEYLIKLFDESITESLISKYYIGTTNKCGRRVTGDWKAATVFWYIDIQKRIRAGQVKLFDSTGHTAKYIDHEGETRSCTDGIHTPIKFEYTKRGEDLPQWLANYIEGKKIFCLFGEHLLTKDLSKSVSIVEAPKSAIIASIYFPQFIWLAVGALSYLTEERCAVLKGRNVILFPDLGAFDKWSARAIELKHIAKFTVSDILERGATEDHKKAGLDIIDFITQYDYREFAGQNFTPANNKHNDYAKNLPVVEKEKPEFVQSIKKDNIFGIARPCALWDIESIEQYFNSTALPLHAVELSAGIRINNVETFVNAHVATARANNGRAAYLPYFERLQQLKNILSQNQITAKAA
ncbi:MAG: hypothetical protein EOO43_02385 [Flavobacterium sp.]|nr:MAG: hypothetical protein EOO43_02385 [Flavobacterium sp.]